MIDLDTALAIIARTPRSPAEEAVPLAEALGRVLARPVASPIDSPPFDKAAMDGFAVAADDDSPGFRILDTVAAGAGAGRPVRRGECARIMTGAMLPPEPAGSSGRSSSRRRTARSVPCSRSRAATSSDGHRTSRGGDTLLGPKVLAPQDIGILAASGIAEVPVAMPPETVILCTGPEIRAAGEPLGPGQIYDSNGPQLAAQLAAMRCPSRRAGRSPTSRQPSPAPSRRRSAPAACCCSPGGSPPEISISCPGASRRWGPRSCSTAWP